MMELLNEIVNYVQIGKDVPEIIDKLLDMGNNQMICVKMWIRYIQIL